MCFLVLAMVRQRRSWLAQHSLGSQLAELRRDEDIVSFSEDESTVKTLGLQWNAIDDCILFKSHLTLIDQRSARMIIVTICNVSMYKIHNRRFQSGFM